MKEAGFPSTSLRTGDEAPNKVRDAIRKFETELGGIDEAPAKAPDEVWER